MNQLNTTPFRYSDLHRSGNISAAEQKRRDAIANSMERYSHDIAQQVRTYEEPTASKWVERIVPLAAYAGTATFMFNRNKFLFLKHAPISKPANKALERFLKFFKFTTQVPAVLALGAGWIAALIGTSTVEAMTDSEKGRPTQPDKVIVRDFTV